MMILTYPNSVLETKCIDVSDFSALPILLDEMKQLMIRSNGIGLAANQVGLNLNMFVMKDSKGNLWEFINPKVIESEGLVVLKEGCLSFPSIFLDIQRPESIVVEFQDREGNSRLIMAQAMEARCILHEIDHLTGVTFLSKVNRAARKAALSTIKKAK